MKTELEINSVCSEPVNFSFEQVKQFAELSGDKNPIHLDNDFAGKTQFKKCIVHGLFAASVFTKIMAEGFPGEGSVLLEEKFSFRKPVYPNTNYLAELKVIDRKETSEGKTIYTIHTRLLDNSEILIDGFATILF
jgi:acyl dehydratase